jgi:S-adenosylmethionine decarboxylase
MSNPIISSGKHLICELKNVKNETLMHSLEGIKSLLDNICEKYNYSILGKMEHQFQPIGITLLYLLSESHISVHTFPEKGYIAMDIYTCREYENNDVYHEIYQYLVDCFDAEREVKPIIVDRGI